MNKETRNLINSMVEDIKKTFKDNKYIIGNKLFLWTYYNLEKINENSNITALGLFGKSGVGKTKYVQIYREILSKILDTDVQLMTFCCGIDSLNTIVGDDEDKNKSSIDKVYLSEAITMANEGKKVILFIDNYNEDNKITDNFLSGFIEYGSVRIGENKVVKLENKNNLQIILARNNENPISDSLNQKLNRINFEPLNSFQILEYVDSVDVKCSEIIKYLILYINEILMVNATDSYKLLRLPSILELIKIMENVQFLLDSRTQSSVIFDVVYESLINTKKSRKEMLEYRLFGHIKTIFDEMILNGEFDEYKLIDLLLKETKIDKNTFLKTLTQRICESSIYLELERIKEQEREKERLLAEQEREKERLLAEQKRKAEMEQYRKNQLELKRFREETRRKEEEAKKLDLESWSKQLCEFNLKILDELPVVKTKSDKFDHRNWLYNETKGYNQNEANTYCRWYQIAKIESPNIDEFLRNDKDYNSSKTGNIIFEYFDKKNNIYNNRLILCKKNDLLIYSSEPVISYHALYEIIKFLKAINFSYCQLTLPVLSIIKEAQASDSRYVKYDINYPNVFNIDDELSKSGLDTDIGLFKNIIEELGVILYPDQNQDYFIIPVNFAHFSNSVSTIRESTYDEHKIVSLKSGMRNLKIECHQEWAYSNHPLCESIRNNINIISDIYNSSSNKILPSKYVEIGTKTVFKLLSNPQLIKKKLLSKGIYIINKGTEEELILFNPYEAFLDTENYKKKLIETNRQLIKKTI